MTNTKINNPQLLPEEQVRQWFLSVLADNGVESYRVATEYSIMVGGRRLRVDIAIFRMGTTQISAIVECKAPYVPLTVKTIEQAVAYNSVIGARYIILTNGKSTFIYDTSKKGFIESLPENL